MPLRRSWSRLGRRGIVRWWSSWSRSSPGGWLVTRPDAAAPQTITSTVSRHLPADSLGDRHPGAVARGRPRLRRRRPVTRWTSRPATRCTRATSSPPWTAPRSRAALDQRPGPANAAQAQYDRRQRRRRLQHPARLRLRVGRLGRVAAEPGPGRPRQRRSCAPPCAAPSPPSTSTSATRSAGPSSSGSGAARTSAADSRQRRRQSARHQGSTTSTSSHDQHEPGGRRLARSCSPSPPTWPPTTSRRSRRGCRPRSRRTVPAPVFGTVKDVGLVAETSSSAARPRSRSRSR